MSVYEYVEDFWTALVALRWIVAAVFITAAAGLYLEGRGAR